MLFQNPTTLKHVFFCYLQISPQRIKMAKVKNKQKKHLKSLGGMFVWVMKRL